MALAAGTRIASYEVLSLLGAGGMGEVYRARDTKLGRDVALKTLPASLASDPERLARFEREARTLASLNHPHIAQIYGIEQVGDLSALVMELVEGEAGALMSVATARGSSWAVTTPAALAVKEGYVTMPVIDLGRTYDVGPDGRFLMVKGSGTDPTAAPASLIVVQHWGEELKRLVPPPE